MPELAVAQQIAARAIPAVNKLIVGALSGFMFKQREELHAAFLSPFLSLGNFGISRINTMNKVL
ncbi:hypothetical protein D3C76_813300 [compost metagenome]